MSTEVEKPVSGETIRRALGEFQVTLSEQQVIYIQQYIKILRHWNEKLNLTAIRDPLECSSVLSQPLVECPRILLDYRQDRGVVRLAEQEMFVRPIPGESDPFWPGGEHPASVSAINQS